MMGCSADQPTMRRLAVTAVFMAVALQSGATDWKQEPDTVLGIRLGEPLPAGSVGKCPEYPAVPTSICDLHPGISTRFMTLGGIPLGFVSDGSLSFFETRVEALHLMFPTDDYDRALAVLTERYGPPTSRETNTVSTLAGGRFDSRTITWSGRNVLIVAVERAGQVDQAGASFVHLPTAALHRAQDSEANKATAGKL